MNTTYFRPLIYLGLFFLLAHQAWAQDWSYYETANVGDMYYDKSRVKIVDKNVISVWTKNVLSEKSKEKYFSILQSVDKAPASPSVLSYYEELLEIDYINRRIKNVSVIFYDQKDRIIYASPKTESGEWHPIGPGSVGDKLSNLVSWESVSSAEIAAKAAAEEDAASKKASVAAGHVPDQKAGQDQGRPKEIPVIVGVDKQHKSLPSISEKPAYAETVQRPVKPAFDISKSKPAIEEPAAVPGSAGITGRDGRFIAFDNSTVLDTRTNLMWAAKDNGQSINWYGAKKYCEKYRGGGYTDWRLPTQNELAALYDSGKTQQPAADQNPLRLTKLIHLTACCPWASENQGSQAVYYDFSEGTTWWFLTPGTHVNRVLPVRLAK